MPDLWLDGRIVPEAEATVSALDRGLVWGWGLFETLRAYGGRVWAVDAHVARLREGAAVLDMEIPSSEALARAMDEVLAANGLRDAGVRITITRGAGPADPHHDPDAAPTTIVTAWRIQDYAHLYENGVALATLAGGGRVLSGVKTTSYGSSVAGRIAARRAGADDALFLGAEGRVLETTGANLFAVYGDRLVTPPVSEGLLPGVTRATVVDVARASGFTVLEEGLRLRDLFRADEVLLTSSLREVYPVRSIDERNVGRGPVAAQLRGAYEATVRTALGAA